MTARASTTVAAEPSAPPATQPELRRAEPCTLIIFGAGDLLHRKLMPSLFHLMLDGLLPDEFAVITVAREPLDNDSFRARVVDALRTFLPDHAHFTPKAGEQFAARLSYISGELADPATYAAIRDRLVETDARLPRGGGRLFYLAIPPSMYQETINRLAESGVAPRVPDPKQRPWVRIIIEKPFGHSLGSAGALNACVRHAFAEHQVYRIDHYLGKETVQNLLVFRFANSIFEPVCNRHHVHSVQITVAESVGVEHRGKYYEEAGVVRDMFQNHLMQLLTLVAMEPPVTFNADAVRDEKVKVLKAIRPITPAAMHDYAVRGQYGPGTIDGKPVPGYRQEPNVAPDSATPTYCAIRFMIDNWRWHGVPFYLRSGKRMPRRVSEIAIQFRKPPHIMFALPEGETIEANTLAIRVQPQEGISLRFEVKVPGVDVKMASVNMDFDYAEAFGELEHEAYETLLLDCMLGEATLFTRSDEVEAAWAVVDPVIDFWSNKRPDHFPNYAAGSWGPAVADEFIGREGTKWREP
ncbi:MAG TPA: glucose-6-phosphate dehydrogenase [Gemmatimonadales bacterium]|jgi:glucose-6-phosphate 1-dehydrogenase|nr:glucose-6-phosphate dehydrogenase [Gemmatimonadales bacterium]